MSRSWKSRVGVLALTATMGIGIVGIATPVGAAGNADNAKACQKNGWKTLVRADQTPFKNQGECVSYAAQGGTPQSPKPQSQLICESLGGTYGATNEIAIPHFTTVHFSCNNATVPAGDLFFALLSPCLTEFPGSGAAAGNVPADFTCGN